VQEKFTGATVLEPKRGFYREAISCLDFASLYPSIIRAHNLSHDTLVTDESYLNLPGVEYWTIEWGQGENLRKYTYVQNLPGVLPKVLENLAKSRKQSKLDMKNSTTDFEKKIHDGKQLAYKVVMNSVYGTTGANFGPVACKAISETTTARGRQMIIETKDFCETRYPGSYVVYGDTDSVFVNFAPYLASCGRDPSSIPEHFEIATKAAEECSMIFKYPNELEFEKSICPLLMDNKKRYAGLLYETSPDKPDKVLVKGMQIVRRDACPFVKQVCTMVMNKLFYDVDVMGCRRVVREQAVRLLGGQVPVCDLVMSKSLRSNYKNDILPHVRVAIKRESRDPGSGPKPPERVPFVYIKDPKEKLSAMRAEDPNYVEANSVEVDYMYYLTNCLESPITGLLKHVIKDSDSLLWDIKRKFINRSRGQTELTSFFSKKIKS
jgi:DNA polymerase delta subunit 1